jgi:tetratricopeptide (TPR) repeat protein
MRRFFSITLAVAGCLALSLQLPAQAPAVDQAKPADESQPPAAAQSSSNPFPEDTSAVPFMPSKIAPDFPERTNDGAENAPLPLPGEDLDPVRSPDDPAPTAAGATDSSSSLAGLDKLLPKPEDDDRSSGKRRLVVKEHAHREASSKDIEVGNFYLQTKNWKAAFSRFESAMVLDPENPEVYWGMAEAERHLGDFASAKANYLKLLDYDPDGPHGRQARKALKAPEIAHAPDAAPGQSSSAETPQE